MCQWPCLRVCLKGIAAGGSASSINGNCFLWDWRLPSCNAQRLEKCYIPIGELGETEVGPGH